MKSGFLLYCYQTLVAQAQRSVRCVCVCQFEGHKKYSSRSQEANVAKAVSVTSSEGFLVHRHVSLDNNFF